MSSYGFHVWILFASLFCVKAIAGLKADEIARLCSRNDPKLDDCIVSSANELRSKLKPGIKSLKVPPLDPLFIPKIQIAQGNGPVSLDSTHINVNVEGLSNYRIDNIHVDFDKKEMNGNFYFPYIFTKGKYQINGKILSLPIKGNGDSWSNYTDVTSALTLKFKPETKNGQEYWTLEKADLDLDVQHATIHMDNLFDGNKQLSDTMNTFISENWREVFQELKPAVSDTIKAITIDLVGKVFKAYPIGELFPN